MRQAQIGRLGIEATANRSLSAAVVVMANGAMIREMKPRIAQVLRRGEHRVLCHARVRGDRQMTRIASDHSFNSRGLGAGAEAIMEQRNGYSDNHPEERQRDDNNHQSSAFHGFACMVMDEGQRSQWRIFGPNSGAAFSFARRCKSESG